jgi:hypothetical protein
MVWLEDVKLRAFFEERAQVNLWVRSGGFHAAEIEFLADKFLDGRLANLTLLSPLKNDSSVKIEQIRSLRESLSLGSFSSVGERRLVVVNSKLRVDAQNALLKILEEPPEGVFFVLLAESSDFYLPTVSSRCQVVFLENSDEAAAAEYLKKEIKLNDAEAQLLFMQAGGSDKNLVELAENPEQRANSLEVLKEAKGFIGMGEFERLVVLKKYSSKELLAEFVEALLIVVEIAAKSSVGSASGLKDFYEKLELVSANIKLNANVKLEVLELVV